MLRDSRPTGGRSNSGEREQEKGRRTMTLTRDAILGPHKRAMEEIQIPEWEGSVWVREMSGAERDAWEAVAFGDDKKGNLRATLAVACLCDADGKRLFLDEDAGSLGATRRSEEHTPEIQSRQYLLCP